jgi:hypothetical protein
MTDDDPIAAIRAELLRLRRDFETHRSMPPAVQGETLDQVIRERDSARADAADARAELKRRDEVTSQLQAEILRLRASETQSEALLGQLRELLGTTQPPQWRREPPDAPGWYWYCDSQLSVRIEHWDAREIAELLSGIRFPHRLEPRWAGPIAEPEEMRA